MTLRVVARPFDVTLGRNPTVIANEPKLRERMKQSLVSERLLRSTARTPGPSQ